MADFFEKLKQDAENVWDKTKEAFAEEAQDEQALTQSYHDLFAWADGTLLATPYNSDAISPKDQAMKTIAVMIVKDDNLVAPVRAVVDKVVPEQNEISLRLGTGQVLTIKVCVGTLSFVTDAHILVKEGQEVQMGEALVHFDQPIEAKSKLMLTSAQSLEEFAMDGYIPAKEPGTIQKGEILITRRAH